MSSLNENNNLNAESWRARLRYGESPASRSCLMGSDWLWHRRRQCHGLTLIGWRVSLGHSTLLEKDRLLPECRETVLALLKESTGQFVVTHWDREKNRQMGRDREHYDYVEDSQLVCDTLEALFRFGTLRGWAGEFLEMLSCAQNEPLKSAWFLECVAAVSGWVFFRGKADPPATTLAAEKVCTAMPELRGVWEEFQKRGFVQNCPGQLVPDRALLERHADVIRNSGELFAKHPTYWAGLFRRLGLAREAPPEEGPAA